MVLNNISNEKYIKYGVPQDSQLGPVLFTIYLYDILNIINESHIRALA